MKYPATFTPDPDRGYVVTFRDIPEAIVQGDDEAEALAEARDGLVAAMDFYFEDRRLVPRPSTALPGNRLGFGRRGRVAAKMHRGQQG